MGNARGVDYSSWCCLGPQPVVKSYALLQGRTILPVANLCCCCFLTRRFVSRQAKNGMLFTETAPSGQPAPSLKTSWDLNQNHLSYSLNSLGDYIGEHYRGY